MAADLRAPDMGRPTPTTGWDSARLGVPLLLVVFNRPETTREVFAKIRAARPSQLYIAADGPRPNVAADADRCASTRSIATAVDWDCQVRTRFRSENLGCTPHMLSAITWFFDNVDHGIVLEDDCVPGGSFFPFCEELLAHYRDQTQVKHIGASNFQGGHVRGKASYYFSRYAHIWGWASWSRAWRDFDSSLAPEAVWDGQWERSIERANGVAVVPQVNLVRNIGFGQGATHTLTGASKWEMPAGELEQPLIHPASLARDTEADTYTYYALFRNVSHPNQWRAYRIWDRFYAIGKALKRRLRRAWQSLLQRRSKD